HLCGKGYWVWLIPLSSGPISIGIVADPRFHPWEEMNTLDGALAWIREHEPQLGASLDGRRDQVDDFLKVENFSYGCKQEIVASNILYRGTPCLLFFDEKFTDVDIMAAVRPDLERIWGITRALEAMYREWNVVEPRADWMRRAIVPTQNFPAMFERHVDMAG